MELCVVSFGTISCVKLFLSLHEPYSCFKVTKITLDSELGPKRLNISSHYYNMKM